MSQPLGSLARSESRPFRIQIQVWHTIVLVAFVAVAISNIQDQRRTEPALIAIATAGFVLYGIIGGFGWRIARGAGVYVGRTPALILYFVAMAALFLVATLIYLMIEQVYLRIPF